MDVKETDLVALQKQVDANSIGLVVLGLNLSLYKAEIAQRRWLTPGGNDVALIHYQHILEVVARTDWPSDLEVQIREFEARVSRFHELLKAADITRVSFEATRMAEAFAALQEALLTWATNGG